MLPLKKQDSTIVSSTHTYESTVIDESVSKLWPAFRTLALDQILPSKVYTHPPIKPSLKPHYFIGEIGCLEGWSTWSSGFPFADHLD